MNFDQLLPFYPRIKIVDPQNQADLFSIIEQSPLSADQLVISFERKPDFFQYLKLQGKKGYAYYFTNQDGTPHGLAVTTFRQMKFKNKSIGFGYTSDLRTTPRLDRVGKLEWRRFYAKVVEHCYEIDEYQKCSGFLTAVWDDNLLAQKALVQKKRSDRVSYQAANHYQSHALWGRWYPLMKPKVEIRQIKKSEISILLKNLCESGQLDWDLSDLEQTLKVLGLTFEDFYVLEKNNEIQAFVLPASTDKMKQTIIKKWPHYLKWSAKLLPLFGKRSIHLHQPLTIIQLMFFRSIKNNEADLYDFVDYFWYENSKKEKHLQFHLLTVGVWQNYRFDNRGYLSSSIAGTLYKVLGENVRPEFQDITDFTKLEVGLL